FRPDEPERVPRDGGDDRHGGRRAWHPHRAGLRLGLRRDHGRGWRVGLAPRAVALAPPNGKGASATRGAPETIGTAVTVRTKILTLLHLQNRRLERIEDVQTVEARERGRQMQLLEEIKTLLVQQRTDLDDLRARVLDQADRDGLDRKKTHERIMDHERRLTTLERLRVATNGAR